MGEVTRTTEEPKAGRRGFSAALAIGWGALVFCGGMLAMMLQEFLAPKVLREARRVWRAGRVEAFGEAGMVYEQFKRTPEGGEGFWIVNLQPGEDKLVAVSTICTHLGCIPNWQAGERVFRCPCHGSGYDVRGVNFEGPAPRPLERYAIGVDAEGYVVVDQGRVFRQELGQWENPESFVVLR